MKMLYLATYMIISMVFTSNAAVVSSPPLKSTLTTHLQSSKTQPIPVHQSTPTAKPQLTEVSSTLKVKDQYPGHSPPLECPSHIPCKCTNLTIDCSSRRLSSSPRFTQNDTKFTHLVLNDNRLAVLADKIFQGLKLTHLDLSFNKITNISDSTFQGLEHSLLVLDFRFNHLSTLPRAITSLRNLEELDISHNKILAADFSESHLLSLRKLMASGNLLRKWPNWLQGLSFLETLDLGYNPVSSFPEDLHNLRWSLHTLILHHCQYKEIIPRQLYQLSRLEIIDLSFNPLGNEGIPDDSFIGQTDVLKEAIFKNVSMTQIPKAFTKLSMLEKLDVSSNNLGSIIDDSLPKNLKELILSNCGLHRIPRATAELKNLAVLELVNNEIKALENGDLNGFTGLKNLDLSSNGLFYISPHAAATSSSNLQHLWLFDNQITELPEVLLRLPNLQTLEMEVNKLECNCRDNWPADWGSKHPEAKITGYCDNLEGLEIMYFIRGFHHYCPSV